MKVIIDRIEEKFAVAELPDGSFADIPRVLLPNGKEGDVVIIQIDRDETVKRTEKIQAMIQQVFEER